jgi:hypothetical protein
VKAEFDDEPGVSVRHEIWEVSADVRHLYEGIYSMAFGRRVTVAFVPEIGLATGDRPALPMNFDLITTSAQARLISLATAQCAVTPNAARAGTCEALTSIRWDDDIQHASPIVFYVTPDEFRVLQAELDALSQKSSGIHDAVPLSDVMEYKVIRFVREHILTSAWFSVC